MLPHFFTKLDFYFLTVQTVQTDDCCFLVNNIYNLKVILSYNLDAGVLHNFYYCKCINHITIILTISPKIYTRILCSDLMCVKLTYKNLFPVNFAPYILYFLYS